MSNQTFKRADLHAVCRGVNDGACTCAFYNCGPCDTVGTMLTQANGDVAVAIRMELERVARNTEAAAPVKRG